MMHPDVTSTPSRFHTMTECAPEAGDASDWRVMALRDDSVADLSRALDQGPPFGVLPTLTAALEESVGATDVALLLADYGEETLHAVPIEESAAAGDPVLIDSTPAGSAYRSQTPLLDERLGSATLLLPVTVRSERFGVLSVELSAPPQNDEVRFLEHVAATLAYVIASARRYTDLFERVRRRQHLVLAAEIQWELLPVLGYEADEFSLGGSLQPAYEVAGDNFDYAVGPSNLTFSLADGMGHGLRAALLTSLCVTALRNSRRGGGDPLDQVRLANTALCEQFGGEQFVTALLVSIDLATAQARAVNAGHTHLWRCRDSDIRRLWIKPDVPLGLFASSQYSTRDLDLMRNDRLILVSDGLVDARRSADARLGEARFEDLLRETSGESPAETVRQLTAAALDHAGGELRDDATALCVDWRGRSRPPSDRVG